MLGVGKMNIPRSTSVRVAEVVEDPRLDCMPRSLLPAFGASAALRAAIFPNNLETGKVLWREDFFGGIGDIVPNWAHETLPSDDSSKG
jgi:hypothetical protein